MLENGLYYFNDTNSTTYFLDNSLLYTITALRFLFNESQLPAPLEPTFVVQSFTDYQNHVHLFTIGSYFD